MESLSEQENLNKIEDLSQNPDISKVEPFVIKPKVDVMKDIQKIYKNNVSQEKMFVANTKALQIHEHALRALNDKIKLAKQNITASEKGIQRTHNALVAKIREVIKSHLTKSQKDFFESERELDNAIERSLGAGLDVDFVSKEIILEFPQDGLGAK